jgi:hypothetical protein
MRKQLFGNEPPTFVALYNSRNIRRKSTSDVILAFRTFVLSLPPDQWNSVALILHTSPVDQNGTDLPAVLRDVAPEVRAVFTPETCRYEKHLFVSTILPMSSSTWPVMKDLVSAR